MTIVNEILSCSVYVCPSLGHTDQTLFLCQSCLQYSFISQLVLTYFSRTGIEAMRPFTPSFMNYSTHNLMVNTAHKISSLCDCIGQGNLPTPPPILLHLSPLSSLHSALSFYLSLRSPLPSCLHYLPLPPSILLPLCASILFLIAPFIREYKYFFPVCCISGCLFFFFCQLSGGLSPFCSALFLAACLVRLYPRCFSSISHQHYSWPPQDM